jgi:hypothetical protein
MGGKATLRTNAKSNCFQVSKNNVLHGRNSLVQSLFLCSLHSGALRHNFGCFVDSSLHYSFVFQLRDSISYGLLDLNLWLPESAWCWRSPKPQLYASATSSEVQRFPLFQCRTQASRVKIRNLIGIWSTNIITIDVELVKELGSNLVISAFAREEERFVWKEQYSQTIEPEVHILHWVSVMTCYIIFCTEAEDEPWSCLCINASPR